MIDFVNKYSNNIYSQFGEDGILNECLKRLSKWKGICVEFGAADGYFCSNTRALIERGWNGYMFDIEQHGDVQKGFITPENVNKLVPDCDVLSIDIDGNDFNVWKAYKGKPAIVIIEINSSKSPYDDFPVSDLQDGTACKPMLELGEWKGYTLLCHTGNLIFIDRKYKFLFPDVDFSNDPEKFFNKSWLQNVNAL